MATIFQRIADATVSPSPRSADRRAIGWTLGLVLALSAGLAGRAWVDQADQPGPVADGAQSMLPAQPTDDLGVTPHAGTTPLQQYTAAGHILGFGVGQVYLASGSHALQISFVDAQPVAPQSAGAAVAAQSQKAPPLTEVRYPDVWPGVDLSYRAAPGGIAESVWRLAPGADPASIRLRYNRPLTLNADGSLAIRFATGILNESAPVAWQERDGQRQPVAVAFALNGQNELGFTLGVHDPHLSVWIDPTLTWNTFLGGEDWDRANAITVDSSGRVYVSGTSDGTWGQPVRAFSDRFISDGFVAQIDNNGRLIWNTFLGGTQSDVGNDIAVDSSGNVYVVGTSDAPWGNPIRAHGGYSNGFVAKLDSNGTLIWNTFLGGTDSDETAAMAVAVDSSGNVYVVGASKTTWGSPVRAHDPESSDGFAAKLDSKGALIWNTFLGGKKTSGYDYSGDDYASGVAVDGSGNVYVGGRSSPTWGSPVRAHDGDDDSAFAAKLNSQGTLIWNTFLGGDALTAFTSTFAHTAIAVDASGNVYVSSRSRGWGSPVRAYSDDGDVFVAQLDGGSGALIWNTFLGGANTDYPGAIAVAPSGNIYVAGSSWGNWGSPAQPYYPYITPDAFAAQLSSNGRLIWNTFLGVEGDLKWAWDDGADIASNGGGKVYVVGSSTRTWGDPALAHNGEEDAFVAQLSAEPGNTATLTVTRTGTGTVPSSPAGIDCGTTCSATFSSGESVTLKPMAGAGYTFSSWGGACSGAGACTVTMNGDQTVTAQFVTAGDAKYLLKVTKASTGTVTSIPGGIVCGGQERACSGQFATVTLTALPNSGYAFKNWVGCPGSTGPKCMLTLTQPATVKANFAKLPKHQLKITKTKNGVITSDPKGLKCGYSTKTCSANFVSGTSVRLTTTPKPGAAFTGWSGACSGKAATCTLIMDGKKGVGATFQ